MSGAGELLSKATYCFLAFVLSISDFLLSFTIWILGVAAQKSRGGFNLGQLQIRSFPFNCFFGVFSSVYLRRDEKEQRNDINSYFTSDDGTFSEHGTVPFMFAHCCHFKNNNMKGNWSIKI